MSGFDEPNKKQETKDDKYTFSSSTGDLDSGEPLAKKYNNCDSEIRERLMKDKLTRLARANKELAHKIALIDMKMSLRAALFRLVFANKGLQITAEKELRNPDVNQGQPQCEFVTAGVCQMESERPHDTIEPKEEHQRDDLKLENADSGCSDVEDTLIHHSESDLDVIECNTEVEEEQEVLLGKKRRASDTRTGATAAKKSTEDTRRIKQKDRITEEQKKNKVSDTKVIQTTEELAMRNRSSEIHVSLVLMIRKI